MSRLADSTYSNRYNEAQQTFSDWLSQNTSYQNALQNAGNMLNQVSQIGTTAAGQTSTAGSNAANTAATAYTNAGTATGASYTGAANALNQGIQNYLSYNQYQNQTGQQQQAGSGVKN